ncbi:hypothetical protein [Paracidovorax cattleyae]|uniref:hypothetical protein n=1 Tax=Paracidovorax cattleyae TaxID=80868 RepID=UPI0018AFA274|nr:hypothetical protein [Paracidovorax cattleyae]MBF9265689.1 hypothetical protein [Paracidovorax cattleyae]
MQRLAHPHAQIEFSAQGPAEGTCDAFRVREALGNFVFNAVKHGDAGATITVNVNGTANGVAISVENPGELDPESSTICSSRFGAGVMDRARTARTWGWDCSLRGRSHAPTTATPRAIAKSIGPGT